MSTNWTYESGSSAQVVSQSTAAVACSPTPSVGDLMICTWGGFRSTAFTSASIADTGSGGWTTIGPGFESNTTGTSCQSWWKIATSADAAATITGTGIGGSGTITSAIECDIFRLPAGYKVFGLDLGGGVVQSSIVTTKSWTSSAGSSSPGFTDALAYAVTVSPAANRGVFTGTNTFTGTSAAANLALCTATSTGYINGQYVGAVEGAAVAGSNTWVTTWSNIAEPVFIGATFVYVSTAPGNVNDLNYWQRGGAVLPPYMLGGVSGTSDLDYFLRDGTLAYRATIPNAGTAANIQGVIASAQGVAKTTIAMAGVTLVGTRASAQGSTRLSTQTAGASIVGTRASGQGVVRLILPSAALLLTGVRASGSGRSRVGSFATAATVTSVRASAQGSARKSTLTAGASLTGVRSSAVGGAHTATIVIFIQGLRATVGAADSPTFYVGTFDQLAESTGSSDQSAYSVGVEDSQ